MKIYFNVDKEGYMSGWSSTRSHDNDISIEVDRDHEALQNPFIFKYENGELIKDEEHQQQLIDEEKERENQPTKIDQLEDALLELAIHAMEEDGG